MKIIDYYNIKFINFPVEWWLSSYLEQERLIYEEVSSTIDDFVFCIRYIDQ